MCQFGHASTLLMTGRALQLSGKSLHPNLLYLHHQRCVCMCVCVGVRVFIEV